MTEAAIYFPYINVPEKAWFSRVLLYWDEIRSIVPYRYTQDLGHLSPYMAELMEADLVKPIIPERYAAELSRAMEPSFAIWIRTRILRLDLEADSGLIRSAHLGSAQAAARPRLGRDRGARHDKTVIDSERRKCSSEPFFLHLGRWEM
jgi:hypothetical protein